jgi:2-polyprenyl-6-hydroxyphenyl methylase/3-demethylubiquinone-9 3-methyltransferase
LDPLRSFIEFNRRLSARVHGLLGPRYTTDGNTHFERHVPWRYLVRGGKVYDVGGGRRPFFDGTAKTEYGLTVVGVDIAADELARAEPDLYDETHAIDVMELAGVGDGDLVVCRALLEHVRDVERAVKGIGSCLKPGGHACVFVPCKNAAYARLNRLLPNGLKRRILYAVYPQTREAQGFPSHYDRCTPHELHTLFLAAGFERVEEHLYFASKYFFFCFPLYLLWQVWILLVSKIAPRRLCETMSLVYRLPM